MKVVNRAGASALAGALLAAGTLACVSTQTVQIECVPENVYVFVDGQRLEPGQDAVALRTDEPHKIYVKGEGYEPQLVVLEPELDENGRRRLTADPALCIEPVPIGVDRTLEIEVEEDIEVEIPLEAEAPGAAAEALAPEPDVAAESP